MLKRELEERLDSALGKIAELEAIVETQKSVITRLGEAVEIYKKNHESIGFIKSIKKLLRKLS